MDRHVKSVIDKIEERSKEGLRKYGTDLERDDYDTVDWLREAQQEAMDLALYLEVLTERIENSIRISREEADRTRTQFDPIRSVYQEPEKNPNRLINNRYRIV